MKILSKIINFFNPVKKVEPIKVDDENYIFPSYGDIVNEFNEFLKVVDSENKNGSIYIKLARF